MKCKTSGAKIFSDKIYDFLFKLFGFCGKIFAEIPRLNIYEVATEGREEKKKKTKRIVRKNLFYSSISLSKDNFSNFFFPSPFSFFLFFSFYLSIPIHLFLCFSPGYNFICQPNKWQLKVFGDFFFFLGEFLKRIKSNSKAANGRAGTGRKEQKIEQKRDYFKQNNRVKLFKTKKRREKKNLFIPQLFPYI